MEIAVLPIIISQLNELNNEHIKICSNLIIQHNIIKNNVKRRRKLILALLKRQRHYRINTTVDKWIDAYLDQDFHG
jgi:hypothetical protein